MENYPQEGADAERLANSISGALQLQKYLFKTQILNNSATGVSGGQRVYGRIAAISLSSAGKKEAEMILEKVTASCKDLITANVEYTRLLLEIGNLAKQKTYAAIVRAVRTEDFVTAGVVPIPWRILTRISSKIIRNCGNISSVYYDLTPKPPATIEFE